MKVLLSIKPEFVERIFSGEKRFEYRKAIFKNPNVKSVVVYATKPVGKLVGEFDIERILTDCPSALWKKTSEFSGVGEAFYNSYFEGRKKGYAIEIQNLKKYPTPLDPYEELEGFHPPQSFMYMTMDNFLSH
ncbi:ASCH domain-containing protein [Shewanella algae]|uniref:ASCH domain-containing protein n=1 Tax=Shewanella algae TaxID=38313 RepID=UPI001AAD97CC|nr:ASCH domain-containing protein [Shewanella algae]MBO2611223.1 ASCH domain-containing protein [Shewanella algae]MBO2695534.1 ASCH domain-containing protein [Shewanella algae]